MKLMKRAPPANIILPLQERKNLANFIIILASIDKRLKTKKAQEKKDKIVRFNAPKAKGIYEPSDIGPPKKRVLFLYAQRIIF